MFVSSIDMGAATCLWRNWFPSGNDSKPGLPMLCDKKQKERHQKKVQFNQSAKKVVTNDSIGTFSPGLYILYFLKLPAPPRADLSGIYIYLHTISWSWNNSCLVIYSIIPWSIYQNNGWWICSLPETNISPLKMDGWNTIVSFWGPAYFQGRTVSFSECISWCRPDWSWNPINSSTSGQPWGLSGHFGAKDSHKFHYGVP